MNDGLFTQQGKHKTHRMHENSHAAWREHNPSKREQAIIDYIRIRRPMTDRQIKEGMGFEEMNQVRPAITAMHDAGRMFEYGSTTCPKTGRTVRVNGLRGVHDIGSYT